MQLGTTNNSARKQNGYKSIGKISNTYKIAINKKMLNYQTIIANDFKQYL